MKNLTEKCYPQFTVKFIISVAILYWKKQELGSDLFLWNMCSFSLSYQGQLKVKLIFQYCRGSNGEDKLSDFAEKLPISLEMKWC